MSSIMLRPDLKTAGGEVNDVLVNGKYVGSVSIIYRERDRMFGAVQLEKHSLGEDEEGAVLEFVEQYVLGVAEALNIHEQDIIATCSVDRFIISSSEDEYKEYDLEDDPQYELVIVNEKRNRVDYELLDEDSGLLANIYCKMYGDEVVGTFVWVVDPLPEEMEQAARFVAQDYDFRQFRSFIFHMEYDGELIDTHELLMNEENSAEEELDEILAEDFRDDYLISLVRDDGDTLTYEIYEQDRGGLPIGTATVDINERQLTGFIDFRAPEDTNDRDVIAALLMEELDKEAEYDTFNVSMLCNNRVIDEIYFENETVH
ncbi:hypothetical protein ABNF22_08605 [Paenibacillus larvae]|uniref:hypothetical protein n=1 Tax=Paenibacillus larvae TaxID=1464 RepID=UPI0023A9ACA2|nr:hypothetical protein [Paenibacillus larvae]MDE5134267.1 hypothetical protein [Paenibacillus larvae subsp. larvae]